MGTLAGTDDLFEKISQLKRQKQAVILAHYYQEPDIQDIADHVGDSLELARAAQRTEAPLIVFAGVHFMAEGAKILNPSRKVVMPDLRAGCSLSDSCPPDAFARFRAKHPDHFVVTYINCSAAIKAQSDVICTSSNAVKIVNRIPRDRPILFAPDRNLGAYVAKQTGREMLLWQGACIVHETFSERKIIDLQIRNPEAELIAHPECEPTLLSRAAFVGSTSALLNHVIESPKQTFIVATEEGILHQMRKKAPGKNLIPAPPNQNCSCNECPFMKLNTLEKVYACLKTEAPEITVPEDVREKALVPLQRMLDWSK
ncbi:MAG: quinolinate synthase [Bdellovibrionales bacterium GWB1_55_8]|nr:MAG: quinolinate synthase [Bdellovibrionales bacterium GWB1_55_8]